jgi:hypothetical protein
MPDPTPPPTTGVVGSDDAASESPPELPAEDQELTTPFESTEDRRFALYMHERENYTKGARDAYQRFDQTIVGLSAGSIVLSINFMKDIGHAPESLPWLFGSWACFLVASFCAFISLLTSGEADRERRTQLDCLVETGDCNEEKANRLGQITSRLNYSALSFCIVGVILIIAFASYNLLYAGGNQWPEKPTKVRAETTTQPAPPGPLK